MGARFLHAMYIRGLYITGDGRWWCIDFNYNIHYPLEYYVEVGKSKSQIIDNFLHQTQGVFKIQSWW